MASGEPERRPPYSLEEAREISRRRAREPIRTKGAKPLLNLRCGRCSRVRREVSRADEPTPDNDGAQLLWVPRCPCDLRTQTPTRAVLIMVPWSALTPVLERAEKSGRTYNAAFTMRDDGVSDIDEINDDLT